MSEDLSEGGTIPVVLPFREPGSLKTLTRKSRMGRPAFLVVRRPSWNPPSWEPHFDEVLLDHHARGLTDTMIAAAMVGADFPVTTNHVAIARRRLGLDSIKKAPPNQGGQLEPPPPKARANPISFAKRWLDGRLVEKPSGYWLDYTPVNLDAIMRAANAVAVRHRAEPLLTSERWKP